MALEREEKREIISALIGPFIWLAIAAFFVAQGFVRSDIIGKIYLDLALINVIAGLINFLISYKLASKKW